jgi:hypothetical protein
MRVTELLLFGVVAWCAIGAIGIAISLIRERRAEALKHTVWLALVAGAYLLVLLGVSVFQKQQVVRIGQDQCYDEMCFAVVGVDEVPGLEAGDDSQVVRVAIRVTNRGHSAEAEGMIEAYLLDSRGRVWEPLAGLSGNRLNSRVAGGSQMLSQPMFRVAKDAAGLGLFFTHGSWQPGRLVVGDSDSLGHRPTVVPLGR